MSAFFVVAYIAIGLIQLFAIMDALAYLLDVSTFVSVILAMVTTYIPLLGSILGVYGALTVWDWHPVQAFLLFFWYVPAFIIASIYDRIVTGRW